MKLLVLSDLHLEFAPFEPDAAAVAAAAAVMLAGDIHKGMRGIEWARASFANTPIIYVAGNHEFYGQHWSRLLDQLRETANRCNVNFLEDEAVVVADVRFLGCSLWTDFELFGADARQAAMARAASGMNDYYEIKISGMPEHYRTHSKRLAPGMTAQRHFASVQWLERSLEGAEASKTVVITHHAPHAGSIHSRFAADELNPAFASNLERLMGKAGLWIHGHTHDSADYLARGTRIICNPRGYLLSTRQFENESFDGGYLVEI